MYDAHAHPEPATPAHASAPGGLPGTTAAWVPTPRRRLGDVVVDAGWVPRETVEGLVDEARQLRCPIGQLLLERQLLTPDQLAQAVAERFGVPYMPLGATEIDAAAATIIDGTTAVRLKALPVGFDDDTLVVAMVDPGNVVALDDIAMLTGQRVRPVVVAHDALEEAIQRMLGHGSMIDVSVDDPIAATRPATPQEGSSPDDGSVVRIVEAVLADAIGRRASDVHFDPSPEGIVVRFRIDGVVHDTTTIPRELGAAVISRLKILAELNIAERRVPQDGRLGFTVQGRRVDLRVVSLPVVEGEAVVLRVLDSQGTARGLNELGMQPEAEAKLVKALSSAHGGVLTTGPTGSGKTTTVYGALQLTNTGDRVIITIEDPVEYRVPGIKQVQVNTKTGLAFAVGLRAMVRADPDVMLVGEIRDGESARIAMQAAITGHLVLSTLHSSSAAATIGRLVDMGVPPYMVTSALTCVVGQRLARRLCDECKRPVQLPSELFDEEPGQLVDAFEPVGCSSCSDTGYRGRVGLYEVMEITDEIRQLALRNAGVDEILAAAKRNGMQTLREDGLTRVRQGMTTLEELARVASG